ncbi:MAG: threonine dehydratase [Kiloniellales bacterium]
MSNDAKTTLPDAAALATAESLVRTVMAPTPLYRWPQIEARLGSEVWVKHENHGPLGAFKVRGGLTYLAGLRRREPDCRGVIAATRGNHGQSIAFAAARQGLRAVILVPQGNSKEKNAAMRALGAELIEAGTDFQEALEEAQARARQEGLHPVPSFHGDLVAGVATCGLEMLRAAPQLTRVYVPIGLGSGICAVAAARAALGLDFELVGIVSAGATAYRDSLALGTPVSRPVDTRLADGMACRTPDPEALTLIEQQVARVVTVTDAEIAEAMRLYFAATHNVAEGAGAAALAAALQEGAGPDDRLGLVLSGGNIDSDLFCEVLAGKI